MMGTEAVRIERRILLRKTVEYITVRQNADGGYTSVQYTDSTLYDTCLALEILRILKVSPPRVGDTLAWVKNYNATNIKDYYLVNRILKALNQPLIDVSKHVVELMDSTGRFGASEVDVETVSEVETTFMCVELMRMLNVEYNSEKTVGFVLSLKNPDGGFGTPDSSLSSTFYALKTLSMLNHPVEGMLDTLRFVRLHENPDGGFSLKPDVKPSFMEPTFMGITCLRLFNEEPLYPDKTTDFILACQNSNGGFRRSLEHGISSFEYTFQAVSSLRMLGLEVEAF
ncbi:MAG: prenyltransferase/squalene oxidase repeat-containing protein [Thermoproteota archaeon]